MKTRTKVLLIIASLLIIIGIIIFVCCMSILKWDFSKLSSHNYQTNEYQLTEDFNNISINSNTADVNFIVSTDGKSKVVCYEQKNSTHRVNIDGDTLKIQHEDSRKWYEYISFGFKTTKINVYLTKLEYDNLYIKQSTGDVDIPSGFTFSNIDVSLSTGDVECYSNSTGNTKITTTTGDIDVCNSTVGSLSLTVSTGDINVENVISNGNVSIKVSTGETEVFNLTCANFLSTGSTGDIELEKVISLNKIEINRSTGDVTFENSDALDIIVITDTGDVKGSLLSNKVFIVKTDTGRISVPQSTTGGLCEITTDTGDVIITVK